MDYLWSPWRFRYLTGPKPPGCIFCNMMARNTDEEDLIVHRGARAFVVLNRFPYTSGHVMVVPVEHASSLTAVDPEVAAEIMGLTRTVEGFIRQIYRPDGINVGMNIGEAAGAAVAGHIHMHVLPRWSGDVNFMTTIAETRVLPEELPETWRRLRALFG